MITVFKQRSEMIEAVFFDLYHTLVRYEPPREVIQAQALNDFGIEVKPEALRRPLVAADEYIYQEISRLPLSKRAEPDKKLIWVQYEQILLKEAGVEVDEKLVLGLLGKLQQVKWKLVLFDDVVPALKELKGRELVLGLISNIDRDISPLLNEMGLPSLLTVIVTSLDSGFTKPQPEIFQQALKQAGGIQPEKAIYVGDQYQVDVVGANQAGMKGVLLDRGDYYEEVNDCPRIQSLTQLTDML